MADIADYGQLGQLFEVPTDKAGQTLRQLVGGGHYDVAASRFGIGPDVPLTAGQMLSLNQPIDPLGNQYRDITSPFTKTTATAPLEKALGAAKPITEQAYAERERQLQGEKQPLTDRYQSIIDDLKGKETRELATTGRNLSTEYGKRGIPISSDAYQQDLAGKQADTGRFYGGQTKEVGFEREDKLRQLNNLISDLPIERARELNQIDTEIAQLKASGAEKQQLLNMQMYRQQKEDEWRQQEMDLQKQQIQLQYGSPTANENDPLRRLFESRIGQSSNNDWQGALEGLSGQFGGLWD